MRFFILTIIAALALAACGGGTETVEGTNTETGGDIGTSTEAAQPSGGISNFCRSALNIAEEAVARVDENDATLGGDLYVFLEDIFRRLADDAPAELKSDFALVVSDLELYAEWATDPLQPIPLNEVDQAEFEAANGRINSYLADECGIDMNTDDGASTGVDSGGSGTDGGSASTAGQTISVGADTYEEALGGEYEVSCDMYGDLETGSIGVYLEGPDFQSSVSSYDSGVEPGTYGGQVWVFASDPALDELVWGLQEIDGTFVLDQAEPVSDEEWSFVGSFSASAEDPPASIEATFSCVGLVGY